MVLATLVAGPAISRAEDEQGNPTAEEDEETRPARVFSNFFPNETPAPEASAAPQSAATPVPGSGQTDESHEGSDLGIGKFATFPFQLSVSVRGGYDDNVITTNVRGNGSGYVGPNADLDYKFGDPRLQMGLRVSAGVVYYFDRSPAQAPTPTPPPGPTPVPTPAPSFQEYDVNVSVGLSLVYKASARLNLSAVALVSYQTEPDFSANVGTNRRDGNYFYSQDRFIGNYAWLPRFATSTSYTLTVVKYDSSAFGAFLDRSEHLLGNEFRFLYKPETTLIADLRLQIVSYDQASSDSITELVLGGIEHNFNPRTTVSLRGGAEFRSFKDSKDRSQPYFEGTLSYAVGKRTSVSWTNRYSLEEPGVAGNQSRSTFRTGLQARYGFTRRISATAGFYYVHDEYDEGPPVVFGPFVFAGPPAFAEDSVDLAFGLRYEIKRNLAIDVGYGHTQISSDFSFREYSRNRYFGGLNVSF